MKMLFSGIILLTTTLSFLFIPWRSHETGAYPENLYTSDGQWAQRSDPSRIFLCLRTEYGFGLSWLVYDKGQSEDAWYIKLDERALSLHVLAALTISVCGVFFLHRRKLKNA
jgi:hypothetical protein